MKKMIVILLAVLPAVLNGQERELTVTEAHELVAQAAADPMAAEELVASTLAAARMDLEELSSDHYHNSLLWLAASSILVGEFGDMPASTIETITDAIVELATTRDRREARRAARLLADAGINGFDGAGEALYRVYDRRIEARMLGGLSMLPHELNSLPDRQGLPYLARMATRNHDEFGEADVHNGRVRRPSGELLDVAVGGSAMLYMSESAEGREMLMELEGTGSLNKLELRWIR